MALLTRDERRNLTQGERRALRKTRRPIRRVERDEQRWGACLARAEDLMIELHGDESAGLEKMDELISILAQEADELLDWRWLRDSGGVGAALAVALEAADGPIAEALLGWMLRKPLKRLYSRLYASGVFDG